MRDPNVYYQLQQDLDCSETSGWNSGAGFLMPNMPLFNGTLFGNGYSIINLTILRPGEDNVGIFRNVSNVNISNLSIVNANIKGKNNVGGLIGSVDFGSFILNSVSFTGGSVSGMNEGDNVGGLIGRVFYYDDSVKVSSLFNCHNDGAISGDSGVGGLIGSDINSYTFIHYFVINQSSNVGYIVSTTNLNAGGLFGFAQAGSFKVYNSFNLGNVNGGWVGGFGNCGGNDIFVIQNSFNGGNITGYRVGGFVGGDKGSFASASGEVRNSYNFGNLSNTGSIPSNTHVVCGSYACPDVFSVFNTGSMPLAAYRLFAPESRVFSSYSLNGSCPSSSCDYQSTKIDDINYFKGAVAGNAPFSSWTFGQANGWKTVMQANCRFDGYPILYWMPDCYNVEKGRVGP